MVEADGKSPEGPARPGGRAVDLTRPSVGRHGEQKRSPADPEAGGTGRCPLSQHRALPRGAYRPNRPLRFFGATTGRGAVGRAGLVGGGGGGSSSSPSELSSRSSAAVSVSRST
jgi:hypothetical protein